MIISKERQKMLVSRLWRHLWLSNQQALWIKKIRPKIWIRSQKMSENQQARHAQNYKTPIKNRLRLRILDKQRKMQLKT